jgi:hypothetical protein
LTGQPFPSFLRNDLILDEEGVWRVEGPAATVSYPAEGRLLMYQVEEGSWWFNHRNDVIRTVVRRLPPKGTVWDIGGGNGIVTTALVRDGWDVILVEAGDEGCRNARRRGVEKVIRASLEDLIFREGTIAAAGLFDVLEHIGHPVDFLRLLRAAIRSGGEGRLYLTVPIHRWLWSREDEWAGHQVRFRPAELFALLEKAGFLVRYHSYLFSFLSPLIFLSRVPPYRLGLDRRRRGAEIRPARIRRDHGRKSGALGRAWERHLNRELARIAAGRVGHGSSLIAVCS